MNRYRTTGKSKKMFFPVVGKSKILQIGREFSFCHTRSCPSMRRLGSKSVMGELCHWSAAVAWGQGRAASTASTGGAGTVVASYPM